MRSVTDIVFGRNRYLGIRGRRIAAGFEPVVSNSLELLNLEGAIVLGNGENEHTLQEWTEFNWLALLGN